jgi:hypothetical protein
MLYPEMMHSVIYEHQKYLRSLWSDEPLFPGADRALRFIRRQIGGALIRFGFRLGGHAPMTVPIPELSPRQ